MAKLVLEEAEPVFSRRRSPWQTLLGEMVGTRTGHGGGKIWAQLTLDVGLIGGGTPQQSSSWLILQMRKRRPRDRDDLPRSQSWLAAETRTHVLYDLSAWSDSLPGDYRRWRNETGFRVGQPWAHIRVLPLISQP